MQAQEVWDTGQTQEVWDTGQTQEVRDTGQTQEVKDTGQPQEVRVGPLAILLPFSIKAIMALFIYPIISIQYKERAST